MNDWKKTFRAIWIAEFLAIAGFGTSMPIVPFYLAELGVEGQAALNAWTGAIAALPSLALALFAPIWGSLADSYGRKLMLLRAMLGGAILTGLMAFVNEPWQLLALRTLQGCVTGTVAAATVLTASVVPPGEAGYRLGLMQMGVFLGNSIGPLLGGNLAEFAGNRVTFLATAVLLAVAALLVGRRVREDFVPRPKSLSVLRNALPDFSVVAAAPGIGGLFLVIFAVQMAGAVVGPIMPLVILDMSGGAGAGVSSLSGFIIGSSAAAGAVGAALIGRLSGRIGYGKTLLACVAGAFLAYLPQAWAATPLSLLLLRIASGAFLGGTMPSVNALIATRCARDRQGATFGLSASVSSVGMALGPVIGAAAANGAGYPAAFLATSAILGLAGVGVAAGLSRRQGRSGDAEAAR